MKLKSMSLEVQATCSRRQLGDKSQIEDSNLCCFGDAHSDTDVLDGIKASQHHNQSFINSSNSSITARGALGLEHYA